jgi:hypothetical protein
VQLLVTIGAGWLGSVIVFVGISADLVATMKG